MAQLVRSPSQAGRLVQQLRQAKGMSQAELGQLVGVRQEMVSKIETGHDAVKFSTLCDLLAALDMELVAAPRSRSSAADITENF